MPTTRSGKETTSCSEVNKLKRKRSSVEKQSCCCDRRYSRFIETSIHHSQKLPLQLQPKPTGPGQGAGWQGYYFTFCVTK
ncbi:hypothetical protein AgCh_001894 [Apium graveolens]